MRGDRLGPYVLLSLVGLLAGAAGGLLGIGGSIVMIPAMNELFGLDQHLHQAAAMIVTLFVVAPATWQHARANAIDWQVVQRMAPAAVVSVLVGVAISESGFFAGDGQRYLVGLFGLFLAYAGLADAVRLYAAAKHPPAHEQTRRVTVGASAAIGALAGLVGGLLGVGGGVVMVPLQRRLLKIPIRQAIANSAATIIALSTVGACMKNYAVMTSQPHDWWKPLALAGVLAPMAVVGATVGSKLTHSLPIRPLRWAFIILLWVIAVRMVLRAIGVS
ncbi:MAG: sulfite exporter TauE/SafE family protein [Phycisphaerae bacterium]